MKWFGFGFNGFGQIRTNERLNGGGSIGEDLRVTSPTAIEIGRHLEESVTNKTHVRNDNTRIRTSWSRRADLYLEGDGRVCLSGFRAEPGHEGCDGYLRESRGCLDAHISERYIILAFPNKVECWTSERDEKKPVWSMEISTTEQAGPSLAFPLVPGGYIASKPPFYRPLSPQLRAVSLVLGTDHAILLTASGVVYTWGSGSHGQLGHGDLSNEEEPRAVEALCGLPMGSVAAGGWHSVCISAGGDMYVWGWNESGQLGLPSRALRKEQQEKSQHTDASTSTCEETEEGERSKEVFITIQAFPALMDITESCEVSKVSCGSRHTAAVTSKGDLYTWGWGEYGQLGQGTVISSDEPRQVEFFKDQQLQVVDVACGPWNTFVSAVKVEPAPPKHT